MENDILKKNYIPLFKLSIQSRSLNDSVIKLDYRKLNFIFTSPINSISVRINESICLKFIGDSND